MSDDIPVPTLALSALPPGAIIFDPSTGSHEHTCLCCGDGLGEGCGCDLSERVHFCPPCYQHMAEDQEEGG